MATAIPDPRILAPVILFYFQVGMATAIVVAEPPHKTVFAEFMVHPSPLHITIGISMA